VKGAEQPFSAAPPLSAEATRPIRRTNSAGDTETLRVGTNKGALDLTEVELMDVATVSKPVGRFCRRVH